MYWRISIEIVLNDVFQKQLVGRSGYDVPCEYANIILSLIWN